MTVHLESEPFAPSGGIDGRAARRAMGKPDMRFWELFLRETLQNSWDARIRDKIGFSVGIDTLDRDQALLLRNEVFSEFPRSIEPFVLGLPDGPVDLMVVSDSGTKGLGGVTRADRAAEAGEPRDFVDFVRNVGRDSSKALGGGTYGFGKGVLYDASAIDTCIIYSQIETVDGIESRLIVAAVKEQFEQHGSRFTGRHWWGRRSDDAVVDPIVGVEASDLAAALGINLMGPEETGTAVAVVAPKKGKEESLEPALAEIARAALFWAWPHLVDLGDGPTIRFRFNGYGQDHPIADPSEHPELQHFVRAYERALVAAQEPTAEDHWPWVTRKIASQRPARDLGTLTYRRYMRPEGSADPDHGSHIALMRDPRFVVRYLEVQPDPMGQHTAGVFVSSSASNDLFAKSEPVAHDDWVPGNRGVSGADPVRIALNKIREEFKRQVPKTDGVAGGENASGVAQVSRMLGSILSGTLGQGAEIQNRRSRGGGSKRPISIVVDPFPNLFAEGSTKMVDFDISIKTIPNLVKEDWVVDASPKIVLDGGATEASDQRPVGAESPTIVAWLADGRVISRQPSVGLGHLPEVGLSIRLRQPEGTAVTVALRARET